MYLYLLQHYISEEFNRHIKGKIIKSPFNYTIRFPSPSETISYFSSDLCRALTFTLTDQPGLYTLEENQLANSTYNEAAWCFNPEPDLVPDYYDQGNRPIGVQLPALINSILNSKENAPVIRMKVHDNVFISK